MKLFTIVVALAIVCCNAQTQINDNDIIDYSPRAVELLEAIFNETQASLRLQHLQYQSSLAQERALNDLITKIEATSANNCYTNEVANVFLSFASCNDIKIISPSAPSGYYNITNNDGTTQSVYCDLEHGHKYLCGSTGWTRIAYLDMSDTSQQCPNEFRQYNGVRACGRKTSSGASCDSITFPVNMNYSQVCGQVMGYQYATPDAFDYLRKNSRYKNIDSFYVDGVSITHGSPRQHIWTFVGSIISNGQENTQNYCPCDGTDRISPPDFVGEDYFCESGNPSSNGWSITLYTDDPLWDGYNCGSGEAECCDAPHAPYFHKVLDSSTTDDVELRLCFDQRSADEDTPINLYEIYVK